MRFICITREHFWKVVWVHTKSKWSSVYHCTSFGCSILSLHLKNHHDSHFPSANVGDVEVGIYLESGGNMISAELWVKPKNHLRIDESNIFAFGFCVQKQSDVFYPPFGTRKLIQPKRVALATLLWQVLWVLHSFFPYAFSLVGRAMGKVLGRCGTAFFLMGVVFIRVCHEMPDFLLNTHLLVQEAFQLTKVFSKSHPLRRLFQVERHLFESMSHNCTLYEDTNFSGTRTMPLYMDTGILSTGSHMDT